MKKKQMTMIKKDVPLRRIIIAFFALLFMVLVVIPVTLHNILPDALVQAMFVFPGQQAAAFLLDVTGLGLLYSTNLLFIRFGKGTLAPWSPPEKLIIRGPYRFLRQPMISGVILVLMGEFIFLASWAALMWFTLFLLTNLINIPLIEEKALSNRFGKTYQRYREAVPGWFPRLTPWDDADEQAKTNA
jgi:protein-S-isoprenylcysteine O-methyltransferase Ste14